MDHKDYSGRMDEEAEKNMDGHYPGSVLAGVAIIMLLIGGGVGWTLGRQSAQSTMLMENLATNTEVAETSPPSLPVDSTSPDRGSEDTAVADSNTDSNNSESDIDDTTASGSDPALGKVDDTTEIQFLPTPIYLEPEEKTVLGDPNAPVTIVEFSDYECPFCARYSETTFPLIKENFIDTGRVYYVFKDFPLTSIHPTAPRVHEVGLCVLDLNGIDLYWEAHDIFFQTQDQWGGGLDLVAQDNILISLMADLGVDESQLQDCLSDNRYMTEVQEDISEGEFLGLSGTPTFFIDGYPLVGALPYEVFEQAITLAEDGQLAEVIAEGQRAQQAEAEAQAQAQANANRPIDVPLGDAPGKGDPNAPITIVEYSDYQCPFCARHVANTMPILQNYIDLGQVYYVFKDFPLESIHPQAIKAHESAHCARELAGDEAYWGMHNLLFESQATWQSLSLSNHVSVFKQLAQDMGLDQESFDSCLDSGRYEGLVRANMDEGISFGITGTPTFFINGQRLVGAQPISMFDQAIGSLLPQQEEE